MTTLVIQVCEQACEAVFTGDQKLAQETITLDARIDEEEVRVEKSAIDLLALQQPAAVDLRTVTTIIKVNADFERIADCAVNIAQRSPAALENRRLRTPQRFEADGQHGSRHPSRHDQGVQPPR